MEPLHSTDERRGQNWSTASRPAWTHWGRVMSFKPKMVNVETNREMSWLGRLLIPGLFNGEHSFTIEALDEKGVRFVQHEKFTGLLVPFMAKSLDRNTKRGFEEMNRALKERAEREA